MVWPPGGWRRALLYLWARLKRLDGSPHSLAAGFACGAAASMTPLMGFHILLGWLLCYLCRGSLLTAVLGTVVGNPWTFAFIWAASYQLGINMLGEVPQSFPLLGPSALKDLLDRLVPVLWPMFIGSLPLGLLAWILSYVPLVRAIRAFRAARQRRLAAPPQTRGAGVPARRAPPAAARSAPRANGG
jgi:uncharacterized protein